jgi:hypothetical protein
MNSTAMHELLSHKKGVPEGKLPVAEVEQTLKGQAQQINDNHIIAHSVPNQHTKGTLTPSANIF